MANITILNTALDSDNDGDHIIVESVLREIPWLRGHESIPTHRLLNEREIKIAQQSDVLIVTGTNIISSQPRRSVQWPLSRRILSAFEGKVVFLGVGWWQYQKPPSARSAALIRRLVHPSIPSSVRDDFTARMLMEIGVPAVNTNCPTMWSLPVQLSAPTANEVVYTVTDYNQDRYADQAAIDYLTHEYDHVYIWPQGNGDQRYISTLSLASNVAVTPRGLRALDEVLLGRDYVGTRLHAGVRAAQIGSSVTIQAVDNRALEIGRDTRLPVVARSRGTGALQALHKRVEPIKLILNAESRQEWVDSLTFLAT